MIISKGNTSFISAWRSASIVWLTILAITLGLSAQVPGQDEGEDPPDGVALFQKAQDLHEKGDLAAAIQLYERSIAALGDFPEAEYQRGQALLSLGRRDEAEKALRRAVEIRPDWTLALSSLGSLLVGKGAHAEAEKFLSKAVSLDDQNTLAYSALVELRLKAKAKPEELRELLNRLTVLTSTAKTTAAAWAARAALEIALGERAAARTSLENSLRLDPKNEFALVSKAGAALDEGDIRGAEPLVRSLESLAPASVSVKALRARLLFADGKTTEALAILNAINDPPPDIRSIRDRMIVSNSEDPAELEKQLQRSAADPFILGRLCGLYRTADPGKALEYCRRASEAEPSNVSHAVGFAAALVQAKKYAEAADLLRKLEPISPENATLKANLATALFQMKRYPEAKAEYRWLIEHQPTSAIAYYFLGITHDQLLEFPDAMANYQLFLRFADAEKNKLEIEKVNLRLPTLQKQIKEKKGKGT